MKIYRVYLCDGLTKDISAERYQRLENELVFYTCSQVVDTLTAPTVIMIDELEKEMAA